MRPLRFRKSRRGAVAVEFILVGMTLFIPLSLCLFYTAQILWIWHSAAEMTREGARYAATHCWQNGNNVRNYMQQNFVATPDRDQFTGGAAEILVTYFGRSPDTGELIEFFCDSECSIGCIPDVVKVQIQNYEYRTFVSYWGLPPVRLPDLQTVVPMEGAGCDPDTGTCNP
jgi:hypothetical protein